MLRLGNKERLKSPRVADKAVGGAITETRLSLDS